MTNRINPRVYAERNESKIAELEEILRSGATSTSIDGTSVTVDLNVIRQQLAELRRNDLYQYNRKPRIASLNLGGLM